MRTYHHKLALEFINYILENAKEKLDALEFLELIEDVKIIINQVSN